MCESGGPATAASVELVGGAGLRCDEICSPTTTRHSRRTRPWVRHEESGAALSRAGEGRLHAPQGIRETRSLGILGMAVPKEYGGGQSDYCYNVVLQEEAARALVTLSTVRTQLDVILPYFLRYANPEQRQRWFPGLAAGTLLTAIAMTEPGTGPDLAGMRTTAVRDGTGENADWIINGTKTFITGGMQADLVIVAARTSTDPGNRRRGLTLSVVEDGMPGFIRGREPQKMGCKVQDTAELSSSMSACRQPNCSA